MTANEKAAPVSRTGNGLEQDHQHANHTPTRIEAARNVLCDAIIAAGVEAYAGVAILAAADSLRKAAVIAALAERIEPEPDAGGES